MPLDSWFTNPKTAEMVLLLFRLQFYSIVFLVIALFRPLVRPSVHWYALKYLRNCSLVFWNLLHIPLQQLKWLGAIASWLTINLISEKMLLNRFISNELSYKMHWSLLPLPSPIFSIFVGFSFRVIVSTLPLWFMLASF